MVAISLFHIRVFAVIANVGVGLGERKERFTRLSFTVINLSSTRAFRRAILLTDMKQCFLRRICSAIHYNNDIVYKLHVTQLNTGDHCDVITGDLDDRKR